MPTYAEQAAFSIALSINKIIQQSELQAALIDNCLNDLARSYSASFKPDKKDADIMLRMAKMLGIPADKITILEMSEWG